MGLIGPTPPSGSSGPAGSSGSRRVLPLGARALLVECGDVAEVVGLHAALEVDPVPGQSEVLAAASTVLVVLEHPRHRAGAALDLAARPVVARATARGTTVVLDTVYDGEDLAVVAELTGMSPDALVARHAGQQWTAAFIGFAPGFAYLVGEDPPFDVPRRATPRAVVPAGAVGLAGAFSAVYPRATPGGWQLIGRTDAPMWDVARQPPALLRPGDAVRFRPVRARSAGASRTPAAYVPRTDAQPSGPPPGRALVVEATGALSVVTDLGRPGLLDLGVSPSGAVDRGACVRANRLVGNPRGAAVVETVLGGLVVLARGDQVLAVTGAPVGLVVRSGAGERRQPGGEPFRLRDGEQLTLEEPVTGLRSYVAVRGGLDVPPVLGSRSTDVLSGLGPAPLRPGDELPVLPAGGEAVEVPVPAAQPVPDDQAGPVVVDVDPGPRQDWFRPGTFEVLCSQEWRVGHSSNRVGLRLEGRPLVRARDGELSSEGMVAGAVQVPPSGEPLVFLADHPVTGGYPVLAVVREAHLDRLAQVRPGQTVRFRGGGPG